MDNKTLDDITQQKIIPYLSDTEVMLRCVAERLSGRECDSHIIALPDLGMPHNVLRMRGGFFTGMFAQWDTDVPFIPVDSTINSCGVSLHGMQEPFESFEDFVYAVETTQKKLQESETYLWNFNNGNHFITYGEIKDKPYLLMHSSAKKYKGNMPEINLYPINGCWYEDKIRYEEFKNNRYLRYICGSTAEKFYDIYCESRRFNIKRHEDIAEMILGAKIKNTEINIQHYGMESINSVHIGCIVNPEKYILLTVPGAPVFIVNNEGAKVAPHGFGVGLAKEDYAIEYKKDSINIGGRLFSSGSIDRSLIKVRCDGKSDDMILNHAERVLAKCSGKLEEIFYPRYSYDFKGFAAFKR